ncbi:MAG: hypothetical protein ABIQ49_05105, partial [Gemmatimonadales bacterium]
MSTRAAGRVGRSALVAAFLLGGSHGMPSPPVKPTRDRQVGAGQSATNVLFIDRRGSVRGGPPIASGRPGLVHRLGGPADTTPLAPRAVPVTATRRPASASPSSASPSSSAAPGIHTEIPTYDPGTAQSGDEPIGVELRIGHLAARTLVGRRVGDDIVLPAAELLDLLGFRYSARGDSIVVERPRESSTLVLSPRRSPGLVMQDQALQVPAVALLDRLGARATVLWDESAIQVDRIDSLPVGLQSRRRRARERFLHDESAPFAPPAIGGRPAGAGFALDYSAAASSDAALSRGSYQVGLTNGLLTGRLYTQLTAAGGGPTRVRGDWLKVWSDRQWIRQLRVGDGITGGPRPRAARGVVATNAPYARPIVVEELPFTGSLPPDWSIEAYRAGQLVSFDSVGRDGRYALSLPVRYGENPTEFVAYGPFGEVRTFNRTFRALPEMLPGGVFEYSAGVGQCEPGTCSATGNLDLRYGASRRWTLRAGLDGDWDRNQSSGHPYLSALGTPVNALGVELETMRGQSDRAGLRFEPTPRWRLTADWIGYQEGAQAPYAPPGGRSAWTLAGRFAPTGPAGRLVWEGRASSTARTTETRTELQVGVAARGASAFVRPYVRAERMAPQSVSGSTTNGYLGVEVTALPRAALPALLADVWLRADGEVDSHGAASRASVTASKNLVAVARLEA